MSAQKPVRCSAMELTRQAVFSFAMSKIINEFSGPRATTRRGELKSTNSSGAVKAMPRPGCMHYFKIKRTHYLIPQS